jgi:hypothetical protein
VEGGVGGEVEGREETEEAEEWKGTSIDGASSFGIGQH